MLPLTGGQALLRETYERARPLAAEVLVLTEARQLEVVRRVLPELQDDQLILEPSARGTANALGLAALTLLRRDPEAVMVSLPADHVVHGTAQFRRAIRAAVAAATRQQALVTIGLKPTYPATGYGYIAARRRLPGGALKVDRFVEKPDRERAHGMLRRGGHYWNLAMFCWPARLFVEELHLHAPRQARGLERVVEARAGGDEAEASRLYNRLPVAVVDYAVMEKTSRLLLVPAGFGWSDVGSWAELGDLLRSDARGNTVEGEAILIDTESSLLLVPDRLVAAVGLRDLVVVETPDALLICPKSRAQDVKKVVEALGRARKVRYL